MENSKNTTVEKTLLILGGAALGAAATYLFTNPNGKELKQKIVDKGLEAAETINNLGSEAVVNADDGIQSLKSQVESTIESTKHLFDETISKMEDEANNQISKFEKGVEKAKANLNNINA